MEAAGGADTSSTNSHSTEDELVKNLRSAVRSLTRREPLEPTYKNLLTNGRVTHRRVILPPKDKFYKRVGSGLRERVEKFMELTQGKDPFDRILQRQPLEEDNMRAAFQLREAKDHEQKALLEATLAGLPKQRGVAGTLMDAKERRRELEAIAVSLQQHPSRDKPNKNKSKRAKSPPPASSSSAFSAKERQQKEQMELERQRKREEERKRREEEERLRILERKRKAAAETPKQKLYKYMSSIFSKIWEMEFANLGGTNPFRVIIDKHNCAVMGAPDYFDYITVPMNLTYIQEKIKKKEYDNFAQFKADVDLIISNALLYNAEPSNPYRVAAEEMKSRFDHMLRKLIQKQKRQQGATEEES